MTAGAQRRVALRTERDPSGIIQCAGHLDRARANLDGALAQALDDGQHPFRMMIVGTDIVVARLDEKGAAKGERGEGRSDHQCRFRHDREIH